MSPDGEAMPMPAAKTAAQDQIIFMLGRMEGKLDAALNRLDGHDDDIDELRHQYTSLDHIVTKLKAYLAAAWAAIVLLISLVATIAAVAGLFK